MTAKYRRTTLFIMILSILLAIPVSASELKIDTSQQPRVLFISSYSLSFSTVPLQISGLESVLTDDIVNLDIEFMDTKHFSAPEDIQNFHDYLAHKLKQVEPYDAIVLGDDDALTFALDYQQELFDDIPMVYMCVNSISLAKKASADPQITGLIETTSSDDNIRLARKLLPAAHSIIAIVDDTSTGKGDQEQFSKIARNLPDMDCQMINASQYTQEELIQKLEHINPDTIVLFMSMFEDGDGNYYSISEGARFLSRYIHTPVFRMSIGGIGEGLVGGLLYPYEDAGKASGEAVLSILDGANPSSLILSTANDSQGMFDQKVMEQYDLDLSLLPADATIINTTNHSLKINRGVLVACGVVLLLIIVGCLNLYLDARRKKEMLSYDHITGIHSRMWMKEYVQKLLHKGTPFAFFMMDFDDFKKVNDLYGHHFGDQLLYQASDRMNRCNPDMLKMGRFGGDEFIGVILSHQKEEIDSCIRQLLSTFDKPFLIGGSELSVHTSVGIVRVPDDASEQDDIIAKADMAMYTVKGNHKNGYCFFEEDIKDELNRQNAIAVLLRHAIEHDGFTIHYQPQIRCADESLYCLEALLRMKDRSVSPGEFIPIAESEGLILEIGRIVAKKVIQQIALWQMQGHPPVRVAINFSNIQLRDDSFPEYIRLLLNRYQVPAASLEIEITESTFIQHLDLAQTYMKRFTSQDISIALDDFGSGFSDIKYFRYIDIYKLKIDKSLLDDYHTTGDDKILRSVIHMAHDMELIVVCEGVETREDYEMMKALSCDVIQGYYFSKPVPPEEVW